jgi:hypothetical protein
MKQNPTSELREQTALYWAGFAHARGDVDVARVHAFQDLARDRDLKTLTDDEVSQAYGGRGWAPSPACWECGGRDDANVTFGQPTAGGDLFALCGGCVDAAKAMTTPAAPVEAAPAPKRSFFSRLKGG